MCLGFVGVMVAMWFVVMLLEEAISLFYNNVKTAGRPMSAKQFKHFYNTISIIRSFSKLPINKACSRPYWENIDP